MTCKVFGLKHFVQVLYFYVLCSHCSRNCQDQYFRSTTSVKRNKSMLRIFGDFNYFDLSIKLNCYINQAHTSKANNIAQQRAQLGHFIFQSHSITSERVCLFSPLQHWQGSKKFDYTVCPIFYAFASNGARSIRADRKSIYHSVPFARHCKVRSPFPRSLAGEIPQKCCLTEIKTSNCSAQMPRHCVTALD